MLKIFIDESGDLGQNEGYFIIAMLVAHDPNRLKNIVKSFCANHQIDEVHAFELDFPQKQYLINQITKQQDYSVSYIILDKMMLNSQQLYRSNNLIFNYLFSFLVKDVIRANTDDIDIFLDNRTQKVASVNSLKDYINLRANFDWGYTKNLRIEYKDSKECKTIQVADLIANAIRRKYYHHKDDFYSKLNIVKSIPFPRATFRNNLPKLSPLTKKP